MSLDDFDDDLGGIAAEFDRAMGLPRSAVAPSPPPAEDEALAIDEDDDQLEGLELAKPQARRREFDFTTGGVWAPAGAQTTITIRPQCVFRCEKFMATDSTSTPGMGTMIVQVAIGQKIQRPANAPNGSLTRFFDPSSRANGISFDTAHAWEDISITVSFVQSCTFYANLFGTAELEDAP